MLLEVLCTGIHVPVVVSSYRLLLQEIARIENHLLNVACHAGDLGCLLSLLQMDSLDTYTSTPTDGRGVDAYVNA